MTGYIYKIIYKPTDQAIYVGQTTKEPEIRFKHHLKADTLIGNYLRLKGEDNFILEIIETVEVNSTKGDFKAHLNNSEVFWIWYYDTFECGLNQTQGGEGSLGMKGILNPMFGRHHTEESKEKNRIAHLGRKNPKLSELNRIRIPWNKGKKGLLCPTKGKHKVWDDKEKNIYHFEL